jgi:hypothetical protein
MVKPLNGLNVSIFPQTPQTTANEAEVAQHGQRRRTEAPIPQGFVCSNPTLRTNCFLVLDEGNSVLTHLLPAGLAGGCFLESASALGCWLIEETATSTNGFKNRCASYVLVVIYGKEETEYVRYHEED